MKSVFKSFVITVIAAVITCNINAQSAMESSLINSARGSFAYAVNNIEHEPEDNSALNGIHPRAVKDFQKSFKGITNEKWIKSDKSYSASFTADSIETKIVYNRNGFWQYTIRSYDEKKLSYEIKNIVKSVYNNYTIVNVAEVSLGGQPIYILYLQDKTHLKTVGVYDGELTEVKSSIPRSSLHGKA